MKEANLPEGFLLLCINVALCALGFAVASDVIWVIVFLCTSTRDGDDAWRPVVGLNFPVISSIDACASNIPAIAKEVN